MISAELRALVVCPACLLESAGCTCERLSRVFEPAGLLCSRCGARYRESQAGDYLDLRPERAVDGRATRYATDTEGFATALDYRTVGPPLLGAAVRQRWLRRWLPFERDQLVLDVGCGDGRFALWNRDRGARIVGIDAAPFFADAARATIDLVRGDVRALPFPPATFDAVYSIDVMEHLDEAGLQRYFGEISRVLKPTGRFFLYSNTRERSTLWPAIAVWNRVGGWLRAAGIGEHEADALRKSDHVKVLRTYEELVEFVARYRLRVETVRFWNGVFQGLVDNVLMRLAEWLLLQRRGGNSGERAPQPSEAFTARLSPRQEASRGRLARRALRVLTALMQVDIMIFGRLRSGPFFAVLTKLPGAANADQR